MALLKPKKKGFACLALAVVLLGIPGFVWWKLEYVYNRPGGGRAILVWKRVEFGSMMVDGKTPEGLLRYKLGAVPERQIFARVPFDDHRAFIILMALCLVWGGSQLYLAGYYLKQKGP